ncbi:MAG: phage tail protein [Leptolyngbyaceae cyanobacterium SL_1_1]|nr:phage tail protein [Leptolyngbyaceae cyanobacterium RM1_1_2]NJO08754.1 phage tail protein [Leptolyngbyaceae cyanobacterium SL_1_1]
MSQAQSSHLLALTLTPMQTLEAYPAQGAATWLADAATDVTGVPQLQVCPGEPSEIVVQIKNQSDRPLHLNLQTAGDFPPHWCQIGTEGAELLPGQQMDAVLYFEIAANFFEDSLALGPQSQIKIDYQGQLYIYSVHPENGQRQQISSAVFQIFVRPRTLYPQFLPALYREVDFIGRLLKIFEQAFEPAVGTLDTLWAYLNPLTAPETLLPFLAYWVGWPSGGPWEVAKQRRLIYHAMEIYRWRGTQRGLRLYLHLYTGLPLEEPERPPEQQPICIEEQFTQGFVMGAAALGQEARLGGGRPFHFIVRLRSPRPEQIDSALVHTIIRQEKPAFCTYELSVELASAAFASPSLPS